MAFKRREEPTTVEDERAALRAQHAALEDEFSDPEALEREIRITVLHELGHYFGLDEDRLAELGYE